VIIPELPAEPPAARVWPRLRWVSAPSSTPWTSTLSIRARRWRRWPSVRAAWVPPRRHGMAFDAQRERAFDLCDTARRGSAGAPSGALRPARSAGGQPRRRLSLRRGRLRRPL